MSVFFFFCIQALVVNSFAVLALSQPIGGRQYVRSDFTVVATQNGIVTAEYVLMLIAAVTLGLAWIVAVPVLAYTTLAKQAGKLTDSVVQSRWGFIYNGYRLGLQHDGLDLQLGLTSSVLVANIIPTIEVDDIKRDLKAYQVVEKPNRDVMNRLEHVRTTLSRSDFANSASRVRRVLSRFVDRMHTQNKYWWPFLLVAVRCGIVLLNVLAEEPATKAFWGAVALLVLLLLNAMHDPYDAAAAGTAERVTVYTQSIAAVMNLIFFAFDWTSPTIASTTVLGSVALPLVNLVQLAASASAFFMTVGVLLMAVSVAVQCTMVLFTALRPNIKIVEEERTQVETVKTLTWWARSLAAFVCCTHKPVELSDADPEVDFDDSPADAKETREHCFGVCVSKRRVFIWCCGCRCFCQRPRPDPAGNILGLKTQGKVLARYLLTHHNAESSSVNQRFLQAATAKAAATS